jgi:hypothetical protein
MIPDQISKDWYRDNYLVSTKRSLIQLGAINDAFDSDLMWWTERHPVETLQKEVDNSLCLGIYLLPDSTSSIAGNTESPLLQLVRRD